VGLPGLDLPHFQAVERDALEGTVPLDDTTSRTQTLVTSHTQPIPLINYDARPFVALGSLAWHAHLERSLICRNESVGMLGPRVATHSSKILQ
jgi:hypothetical protein